MSLQTLLLNQAPAAVLAIAGIWLFITNKVHPDAEFRRLEEENRQLKAALDAERRAVNEAAGTGSVTNQLVEALVALAADRKGLSPPVRHPRSKVDLTGEDSGL